jgi:hypothetical protein
MRQRSQKWWRRNYQSRRPKRRAGKSRALDNNNRRFGRSSKVAKTTMESEQPRRQGGDLTINLRGICYRCGEKKHKTVDCRHKYAVCSKCKKTAHLAAVCLSTSSTRCSQNQQQPRGRQQATGRRRAAALHQFNRHGPKRCSREAVHQPEHQRSQPEHGAGHRSCGRSAD